LVKLNVAVEFPLFVIEKGTKMLADGAKLWVIFIVGDIYPKIGLTGAEMFVETFEYFVAPLFE
jgi:hypothetical protein